MYEEDQMSKANEYNALRLLIATINQIQCFDRYLLVCPFLMLLLLIYLFIILFFFIFIIMMQNLRYLSNLYLENKSLNYQRKLQDFQQNSKQVMFKHVLLLLLLIYLNQKLFPILKEMNLEITPSFSLV